jgi:hypothetical protein
LITSDKEVKISNYGTYRMRLAKGVLQSLSGSFVDKSKGWVPFFILHLGTISQILDPVLTFAI